MSTLPHRLRPIPRLRAAFCVLAGLLALPLAAEPARFEDSMAQRMQACTACHGEQGRAGPDGYYPRLAGKPAGYLYQQMLHFRDGQRHYRLMTQLMEPLSERYLREMAEYFAALDLPYPAPSPVPLTPLESARGEALALRGDATRQLPACVQCHGAALTGVQPATPGLLGLPRDYLNSQLGAWRSGLRRAQAPDCMATIAQALSPAEVSAVSGWLASQPLPAHPQAARALPARLPLDCGSVPGGRP